MEQSMSTMANGRGTISARTKLIGIPQSQMYLREVSYALSQLPFAVIDSVSQRLWNAYLQNRVIYLFGNGGSAALASHCACDLGKGTSVNGHRRFRVLALTDNVPLLTAWANDARYEDIFAEQLRPFLQKSD